MSRDPKRRSWRERLTILHMQNNRIVDAWINANLKYDVNGRMTIRTTDFVEPPIKSHLKHFTTSLSDIVDDIKDIGKNFGKLNQAFDALQSNVRGLYEKATAQIKAINTKIDGLAGKFAKALGEQLKKALVDVVNTIIGPITKMIPEVLNSIANNMTAVAQSAITPIANELETAGQTLLQIDKAGFSANQAVATTGIKTEADVVKTLGKEAIDATESVVSSTIQAGVAIVDDGINLAKYLGIAGIIAFAAVQIL